VNTHNITQPELNQAAIDSLLTRIADLKTDIEALRETLHASVALNHKLHEENARLRICLKRNLWETYGIVLDRQAAA